MVLTSTEAIVTFLDAILPRKKPAPKFPGPGAATSLLKEVTPYDIQTPYRYHQITAGAVAHAACHGLIEFSDYVAAEDFRKDLCKKTGWQQPRTFAELARRVPRSERTNRTIDLGFIWRLWVVKRFAQAWVSPPTLTILRKDVTAVQQAALYCPEVLAPLLCRMWGKYDNGLWIIGEHFLSWQSLFPRMSWSWGELLPDDWDCSPGWQPSQSLRTEVDFDCMHILHEIELHQQPVSNKGKPGSALLAKVAGECWHQWRWCGHMVHPERGGQFPQFLKFVGACMDLVAPRGVSKGCRDTIRRYVESLMEENKTGLPPWRSSSGRIPGGKRTDLVRGHNKTYFPRRRKYFWPILRIQLKAYWNLIRGYPASWDNHDRIM